MRDHGVGDLPRPRWTRPGAETALARSAVAARFYQPRATSGNCKLVVVRTACVTISDPAGRPFVHVTMARTVFEATANAIDWFTDPYWHGPKPRRDTVYEV